MHPLENTFGTPKAGGTRAGVPEVSPPKPSAPEPKPGVSEPVVSAPKETISSGTHESSKTNTTPKSNEELDAKGKPVVPTEQTLDHRLNKELYLNEIAQKYRINLKGSGQKVEIMYDSSLGYGSGRLGTTKHVEGGRIIRIGPDALADEATTANTIAHELSHARDYLRGAGPTAPQLHKVHGTSASVGDGTPYGSGNALEEYIKGNR